MRVFFLGWGMMRLLALGVGVGRDLVVRVGLKAQLYLLEPSPGPRDALLFFLARRVFSIMARVALQAIPARTPNALLPRVLLH